MIKPSDTTFNKSLTVTMSVFIVIVFLQVNKPQQNKVNLDQNEVMYTLSPEFLTLFSIGQEKAISGYLWMKTLLDIDTKHVNKGQLSWAYHRFNLISILNDKFYENYLYGGIHLSIAKDDIIGAEKIYRKGLIFYPKSQDLLWNRAFNMFYEIGDLKQALPILKQLVALPNQKYKGASRIAAKIEAGQGSLKEAFNILLKSYLNMKESYLKEKTKGTLYAMKAQIDLKCLNNDGRHCQKNDFFGNSYILDNGIYKAKLQHYMKEKLEIKQ